MQSIEKLEKFISLFPGDTTKTLFLTHIQYDTPIEIVKKKDTYWILRFQDTDWYLTNGLSREKLIKRAEDYGFDTSSFIEIDEMEKKTYQVSLSIVINVEAENETTALFNTEEIVDFWKTFYDIQVKETNVKSN